MARVTLDSGETITVGGTTEVYGTAGQQSVTVIDGSAVTFRSGFNTGGDAIRLTGTASDFVVSRSGSNVILFSATDNLMVTIPVGNVANTIVFDNGDSRQLRFDGTNYVLGSQSIGTSAAAVTAGAGTYTVSGPVQGSEGDVVTYTVTRTDASNAENLTYTVSGSTNGGTVTAAVPGVDFTAAGNTVSFAADQHQATFTVDFNLDNSVEGTEGLKVAVMKGLNVVATTTSLIADENNVGQTFALTGGVDSIGTGSALDLIGSEGSTNTNGQDRIVGTSSTINVFDHINGGSDRDIFQVLDDNSLFSTAPSFTNVTVENVEQFTYTSTRGLLGGTINTSGWTGLETADIRVNGNTNQTVHTATTMTDVAITNAGNGEVIVNGGGGRLTVNAAAAGDVDVGQAGFQNDFTTATINGGNDVRITDVGAAQLTTVNLNGFADDATLTGSAIATVNVTGLSGSFFPGRLIQVNAPNPIVNLSNSSVFNLDVTGSASLTVNGGGNVSGVDDITGNGTVTVGNNIGGTFNFDDVINGATNAVVNFNAASGSLFGDDVDSGDVRTVNVTGAYGLRLDSVTQASHPSGTLITATNGGGVTIVQELGNNTQFNGSGDTGNDWMQFGATTRANTFGGGDDIVYLNSPSLGVNGSLDGGAGRDMLAMESNNAAAFTAAPTATSNFEVLYLTGQTKGLVDVINLANIGFTNYPGNDTTDVVSNVGPAAPVAEVVKINFQGAATWTDSVTFDGVTVNFADNAGPAALATAFITQYGSGPNWVASAGANPGEVILTSKNPGFLVPDLTPADFVFTDARTLGSVGFEQITGAPFTTDDGSAPIAGTYEGRTLVLTSATVLATQTITISEDINFLGPDPVFTFTASADMTHVGGELATFIVSAFNNVANPLFARWTASVSGNDVQFTAKNLGHQNGFPPFTNGNFTVGGSGLDIGDTWAINNANLQGITPVPGDAENVTFTLDGVATGNDQVIFDGQTITFTNGMTPGDLADAFQAQYSAVPLANRNWTVTSITPWGQVNLESKALANVSNLTANAFQFVDDTNIGTPSLGVAVTTQGSASSVTLNNFTSGSTLTLENQDGTHIVNVQNNTAADVFNLVTGADGNLGSVTANWAETVNIDTLGGPGSDTLVLNDTSAKTITATGGDDLTIDTDSTKISLFDASSLGGKLTWAADANTVAITVKTGSGGSDVDFSAIAIPGLAPITFLGGSGADEVTLGDLGASRANITLGVGADIVHVGLVDGGNDYSSVLDFNVAVDKLSFAGGGTLQAQDQVLEPTAEFQDYLDQAADGAAGEIHFFHWNGDTYVVKDNTNGEDFQDASDTVIRLQGLLTLTPTNFI